MVAHKASASKLRQRKTEMLGTIYKMLAMTIGEPVKSFEYAFKDKN